MATDNSSFTLSVGDDLREKMYRHVLGEEFTEEDVENGIQIPWDDIGRPAEEARGNAEQGFIAEAALSQVLDQAGVEHEWLGGEGQDDLVLESNRMTIDVKARSSKCDYRNLIKDYAMSNSDSVDLYILANVHYHPIKTNEITAVEFVGYIHNDEFETVSQPVKLYTHEETEKAECQPSDLKPIRDLLNIAQMF